VSRVLQLPPDLINKIAAGEVVVRPASAAKELVENSLDAGATQISIEIENGCRDLIVTDNGRGMDREDAEMALRRHATSKIASLEDLMRVQTAGFRGEALPAIASVSRLRMQTRPPDQAAGLLVEVEGGQTRRMEPCAAPPGTRIEARDLFFNVPARRKFLKSPASEFQAIVQIIERLALSRPDVGFALSRDGRKVLQCRPCADLAERFVQAMGARYEKALLPIEARWTLPPDPEVGPSAEPRLYRVRGVMALPAQAGKDRSRQFFFANNRPIRHRRFAAILAEAGRGFVMSGRHLAAAIFVDSPPEELDVNVHPAKEEARFAREDNVCGLLYRAVKETCSRADLTPTARLGEASEEIADAGADDFGAPQPDFLELGSGEVVQTGKRRLEGEKLRQFREIWLQPKTTEEAGAAAFEEAAAALEELRRGVYGEEETPDSAGQLLRERPSPLAGGAAAFVEIDEDAPPIAPDILSAAEERGREAEAPFFRGPEPRLLGQIGLSYIFAEVGDDALIIDQHAAHERLLYHKFSRQRGPAGAQRLLTPIVADLPLAAAAILDELLQPLAELGMEVERFGGDTYQIVSVPADAPDIDAAALLLELAEDFGQGAPLGPWRDRRHRVAATLACKAAVKAGQKLSVPEMERLIRDMRAADLPFTCPHGRPTMIRLTRAELDREFKRR
jgi:DNA mismatch repair protein MutL